MIRSTFSASNLHRRSLCPGSQAMEEDLPEVRTKYSDEGTLLHRHLADPSLPTDGLAPDQITLLEQARALEQEFLDTVTRQHNLDLAKAKDYRELPLEFTREDRPLFWNHLDRLLVWKKERIGVIIDYKSGWLEVPDSDVNLQLRCYSLVAADTFKLSTVHAAILPARLLGPVQSVLYEPAHMPLVRRQIENLWDACHQPDARRTPSYPACQYCKGFQLGVCPEARALALSVNVAERLAENPAVVLAGMSAVDRTRLFDAFALAEKLRKTFTDAAKLLVARDPEYIPGWKLVPGGTNETVTDQAGLRERLYEMGVSEEQFLSVCKPVKESVANLVREKLQLKGKGLDAAMDKLLDGLVDRTPKAPSLRRCA